MRDAARRDLGRPIWLYRPRRGLRNHRGVHKRDRSSRGATDRLGQCRAKREHHRPRKPDLVAKGWGLDQSRIFAEVRSIHAFEPTTEDYLLVDTLKESNRGAVLLRRRPETMPEGTVFEEHILGYQALGYSFDPEMRRLVLAWGDVRRDEASALADIGGSPPTQESPCTGASEGGASTTRHYRLATPGCVDPANVY